MIDSVFKGNNIRKNHVTHRLAMITTNPNKSRIFRLYNTKPNHYIFCFINKSQFKYFILNLNPNICIKAKQQTKFITTGFRILDS